MNTNFAPPGVGVSPFNPDAIAGFGQYPAQYGVAGPGAVPGLTQTGLGFGSNITPYGGGLFSGSGLGFNVPTFNTAFNGLQTLGGLWAAFNAAKVAKQQLRFSKDMANANLANQTQSYNTALEDRIRSRAVAEGQGQSYVDDYLGRNRLQNRTVG